MSTTKKKEDLKINEKFYFFSKKMRSLMISCIESRVERNQSLYGCFKIGPFYRNHGLTVATILRRSLLSNLEGLAVVFVQIKGVKHEYSILKGVQESVLEILTHFKNIQFKTNQIFYKPQIAYLNVQGPKIVYSKDIQLPASIQCVDPSQYIATLAVDGKLKIKLFICRGKRFCLQTSLKFIIQEQFKEILNLKPQNFLFIDSIFLPIQKVNFALQQQKDLITENEFIVMEIWTNGSLYPKQSLFKAVNEIIYLLIPFRKFKSIPTFKKSKSSFLPKSNEQNYQKTLSKINSFQFRKQLSSLDIGNLNLSGQTHSYLKKRQIHTISDLLRQSKKKWVYLKRFQPKFFQEIEANLLILGFKIRQ